MLRRNSEIILKTDCLCNAFLCPQDGWINNILYPFFILKAFIYFFWFSVFVVFRVIEP